MINMYQPSLAFKITVFVFLTIGIFATLIAINFPIDSKASERQQVRFEILKNQMYVMGAALSMLCIGMIIFQRKTYQFVKKRKNMFINLLVLLIVFIICFAFLEIALRLAFAQQIYDEYGFGPGGDKFYSEVIINSQGYRDTEHAIIKPQNTTRILVLGDSFTFGVGVRNRSNLYTNVLQEQLNQASKTKYEVIALAKGGYSTRDQLKALNDIGLQLNPDIIILQYFVNDAESPGYLEGYEKFMFHHYVRPYELGYLLYRKSFAYYFVESRIKNIARALGFEKQTYQQYINHLYEEPFYSIQDQDLNELLETATNSADQVIVLNIPVLTNFESYPFDQIDQFVKDITLLNEAQYVPLIEQFKEFEPSELIASHMDAHMNELGHEITAQTLQQAIQDE